ncbi:MAG: sigma-70 family RNA polymerase sigma factor [Planctomycetales bacterium]|nr:sigma-70 family RNA polymerase sigma factor [Planctomycetales bacterium]
MRLTEENQGLSDDATCLAPPEQWVAGCVAGDRRAMQSLYEHCSGRIYALMVRMVGQQDADDLTQQVFLQMFRKLAQFNGQSKLETWLYRLATNEALQHHRRKQRRSSSQLVEEPVTASEDRVGAAEELQLLETALSRLAPELRAILLLKEQEKLSYREIAEAVAVPEGTVGSRLNRARRELREELIKLGWVEG